MAPSTTAPRGNFTFGVEIELLVKPKTENKKFTAFLKERHFDENIPSRPERVPESPRNSPAGKLAAGQEKNRDAIRETIANALRKLHIKALACDTHSKPNYDVWSVMDEAAVDEPTGFWGIEIVSKVNSTNSFGTPESWLEDFRKVFEVLEENFWVRNTTGCSMHVHVAPGLDTKFTDEEVRSICRAICYFDNAIAQVVPAHRKYNRWCDSNCAGTGSPAVNAELKQAYAKALKEGWRGALFNSYLSKSRLNRNNVYRLMQNGGLSGSQGRYVSWNFQYINDSCGTIEFRHPPGVKSEHEAFHWVAFTLGFISKAIRTDWDDKELDSKGTTRGKPDFNDLNGFVMEGISAIPSLKLATAEDIGFKRLNPYKEGPKAQTVEEINEEKRIHEEIRLKQELKAQMGDDKSPFATKANSQPGTPVLEQRLLDGVDMNAVVDCLNDMELR